MVIGFEFYLSPLAGEACSTFSTSKAGAVLTSTAAPADS